VARVAFDADVVIAFLDAADDQHERAVSALRPRLTAGEEIVLSASVYAEIMVRPMARGTDGTVDEFLDAINATVIAVDRPAGRSPCSAASRTLPIAAPTRRPIARDSPRRRRRAIDPRQPALTHRDAREDASLTELSL